jgi:DNA repair protein RadA/Sms
VLGEIDVSAQPRLKTGIGELDQVLGDGLVPSSVVLLGGEPGVGKSTLALQLAARLQQHGGGVLYVSGEESPEQIRLRADRLLEGCESIRVLTETRVEALSEPWRKQQPALVLVDSIQAMRTDRAESAPGSVAQVRESAALLAATAKAHDTALVLIGHVTKEGTLAGPRLLEHLVDVVLGFEGDRNHAFRILRASKNRFGSTQEVGVFTMGESGLTGVENPSEFFLAERRAGTPGSCIVPLLEGSRPMLVEIQALVAPATYGTPRRTSIGIEDGRVALLLAVLDRRTDVDLLSRDVYVNAAGGVRVGEPGADLGLAVAIASSRLDLPIPADLAACGEVGLGGEVRRVSRIDLRVRESARLGFSTLMVPRNAGCALEDSARCRLVEVAEVEEAVAWLRRSAPARSP